MKRTRSLLYFLICFIGINGDILYAQDSALAYRTVELAIPEELMMRLPEDQIAQFIQCRERALSNTSDADRYEDMYQEIGVSRETLSRIPSDQLFRFLQDRGYVELDVNEHINFDTSGEEHSFNAGPSPKQVISILYLLISIVAFIIILSMVLVHYQKKGDQKIVITALEHGVDIPFDIIRGNRKRSLLRNAIVVITLGFGMFLAGTFDVFPSALGIIPLSIGVGLLIASRTIKD